MAAQQTAVEWIYEKLANSSSEELVGSINAWFDFAKIIEKKHIMSAHTSGQESAYGFKDKETAEEYYAKTYDKE
jgi:hypothetical protein